ncbi:hypothetical protein KP509_28G000400 [Ceratopteris richardii]|nr:hypothetical protein KP509_28G000400 [Ceratopteris richardii]
MISALSKHGHSIEALHLLCKMQLLGIKPDNIAYVCVLEACASIDSLEAGQLIHMSIIDAGFYGNGAYVENALVVMYGILSSVDDAQSVFHNSSNRGVVSLTAMAGALLQAGHGKETLELFSQALLEGTVLDKIILLCAVDACASLASLDKGLEIHTIVLNGGHCQDLEVGNALVNMYGKCAALHHASSVLFKMSRRDIFSWNTLISACVQNGGEEQVWSLLYKMELEGLKADETTFHSILTACSHAGWNEMGKYTFCLLINDEFILPCADYHVCMVDLLGRSGLLEEAEYAAHVVNHGKNALAWLCLLGACKVHGDVERGLKAARFCMEMDPKNSAVYILLSNIYSMSD